MKITEKQWKSKTIKEDHGKAVNFNIENMEGRSAAEAKPVNSRHPLQGVAGRD